MRPKPPWTSQRWMIASITLLVLAQIGVFLSLARGGGGGGGDAPATTSHGPALAGDRDDGAVVRQVGPQASTSPSWPCRSAGGTCVGLEAGACARGTLGDPARFACGSDELRCCLPRSSGTTSAAPATRTPRGRHEP